MKSMFTVVRCVRGVPRFLAKARAFKKTSGIITAEPKLIKIPLSNLETRAEKR